jgi:hypothetical protein
LSAARPLRLDLSPSVPLAAAIAVAHGAAAWSAAAVLAAPGGIVLAGALAALGLGSAWSRALLRSSSSIRALELVSAGEVVLELRSGRRLQARVAPRRYVGGIMVALQLRGPVRRTLLVTADMLPADLFRKLRIWAAWGRFPGVAAKQLPS